MARKTTEERLAEVHDRAMRRFRSCYPSQREIRLQCLQDRRFVYVPGAQWEGDLGEQFANRPRFEVNKVHMAVTRIFSEYRNNRISVDFRAKDNAASEDTAEMLDGLYRADEQESNAQEAYDNAFDEGVAGGMGAWRLVNKYEDDESEDDERQRICMEPIFDADSSVFFDIDAKRQDKADAKYCFVISSLGKDDYEEEHGEVPTSFQDVDRLTEFDWFSPDVVYLAEYYEIEERKKSYFVYVLPATGEEVKVWEDEFEEKSAGLVAQGFMLARKKTIKQKKVHKYLIDGSRVLEDMGYCAGKYIPVIPFYGKRGYVDNIERIQGHVRLTTDLMRLYNMLVSLLAEISVHSPIEKPIFTPEQIQGHEMNWARDNIDRPAYQLINPMTGPDGAPIPAGPVGYTKPPNIPPGLAALLQLCNIDLKELLGNAEAGEEVVSNISAKAIELVQNRLDMQTFIYMDNMSKAMAHCGRVWLSMARELYDEEGREMKIINPDGSESEIELMRPTVTPSGAVTYENDLSSGRYDVVVDVGPSFTTRRDATVRTLSGVLQYTQDPTERSAIVGVLLQNIDGEGIQDLKDWNRQRLIRAGIAKPTDEEAQALAEEAANTPPDPQVELANALANEANAKSQKAQADTVKVLAESEKTTAETAKILSETDSERIQQILNLLQQIQSGQNPERVAQQ
jgi:hypothetical protein